MLRASCAIVFSVAFAFATSGARGAEFFTVSGGIHIEGEIVPGDAQRLADYVLATDHGERYRAFLNAVWLQSPGGDVAEAMKIARLAERALTFTFVEEGGICASACFLIWSAGASRFMDSKSKLGVHRLSLAGSSLDVRQSERAVVPAAETIGVFLAGAGIPRQVIDKMNETPSSSIFWVTTSWVRKQGIVPAMGERASFLDVAEKTCGVSPFHSAVEVNKDLDMDAAQKWSLCSRDVRAANQRMRGDEIRNALVAARAPR